MNFALVVSEDFIITSPTWFRKLYRRMKSIWLVKTNLKRRAMKTSNWFQSRMKTRRETLRQNVPYAATSMSNRGTNAIKRWKNIANQISMMKQSRSWFGSPNGRTGNLRSKILITPPHIQSSIQSLFSSKDDTGDGFKFCK